MIVGTMIDRFARPGRYLDETGFANVYFVTVVERALHATKGWRVIRKERVIVSRPRGGLRLPRHHQLFTRTRKRGEEKEYRFAKLLANEAARERALMRHGWYRKKLRKQA